MKSEKPLYIKGQRTTIKWVTFELWEHAVLNFADYDNPVEWEITKIWNHIVYLNWTMYQLNNCVSAEKIDLAWAWYYLSLIEQSKENIWDAFASIEWLSISDLQTVLKLVNDKLEINIAEFNKINIPEIDNSSNTRSLSESLKAKTEILEQIRFYEWVKTMLSNRLDELKAEEIKKSL